MGLEVGLSLSKYHPKGIGHPHIPTGGSSCLKSGGRARKASKRAELGSEGNGVGSGVGEGGRHRELQEEQKPRWGKVSPAITLSRTLESAQQRRLTTAKGTQSKQSACRDTNHRDAYTLIQ